MKERLKRLPLLRTVKTRLWSIVGVFQRGMHRAIGILLPHSKFWGSPRNFQISFHNSVNQLNQNAHPNQVQSLITIMQGSTLVPASEKVSGKVPPSFKNDSFSVSIKEYIAVLKPARLYTKHLAMISASDTVIGEASAWFGSGFSHPVFKTMRLPNAQILAGKGLYLRGGSNYFHFLTDVIPKVRLLHLVGLNVDDFDYILMESPKFSFEHELLQLFDIPVAKIIDLFEFEHYEAEELTIPTVHNREGEWFVEYIKHEILGDSTYNSPVRPERRLYISRRNANSRKVINEDKVFALLQLYGFDLIDAEMLSVVEQAKLFQSAAVIIGPHGAGLTNILFSSPGTKMLELRSSQHINHTDNCFQRLCAFAQVKHSLLFCEGKRSCVQAEGYALNMIVDLDELQIQLVGLLS